MTTKRSPDDDLGGLAGPERAARILVPLDGSPGAEAVLPVVAPLAARLRAQLVLIAVHQPDIPARGATGVPYIDRQIDEESRAAMGAYLRQVADRLPHREVPIDTVALQGDPSERLARFAETSDIDLVAIASHGRGGFSRLWLGSVTDRLLRHLTIPMLVVHTREPGEVEEPARPIRRVLIALDGSVEAEAILPTTLALLGREIEYTLVRVAHQPNRFQRVTESPAEAARDTQVVLQEVEDYLATVGERLRADGYAVRSAVRVGADPARTILAAADEEGTDLIAITTHGAGVMQRAILGSVADKVTRGASVPVLVKRLAPREAAADRTATGRADVPEAVPQW